MCSNVYDDGRDFDVCGSSKNSKYLDNKTFFSLRMKKIIHHTLLRASVWQKTIF